MNEKELKSLVKDILSIDKTIFDQQLGIEWYAYVVVGKIVFYFIYYRLEPNNTLMNKTELVSYKDATKALEKMGS